MTAGRPTDETGEAVEAARKSHAKAMEALGADVHPYSATAIRQHEADLDLALSVLAARAHNAEKALERIKDNAEAWHGNGEEGSRRALVVIAKWCDDALAVLGHATPAAEETKRD